MKSPVAVFLLVVASGLPCWSRERDGEFNFLVLGDWGGKPESPYTTDAEREVAEQMGTTAAEVGSLFTMALGDNFYDMGVKDASDPRFQNTFEVGFQQSKILVMIMDGCFLVRMCSRLRLSSLGGTLCAETMITMEMHQQRWRTPRCLRGGTCLSSITLR